MAATLFMHYLIYLCINLCMHIIRRTIGSDRIFNQGFRSDPTERNYRLKLLPSARNQRTSDGLPFRRGHPNYFKKFILKKFVKIWWNHQLIIRFLYSWIQLNCCLQKMTKRFQISQKSCINEKSDFFSSQSYSRGLTLRSSFQNCSDSMFVSIKSIIQQWNEFYSISITQKTFASATKTTKSLIKKNV